ncbi:MAG: K(+)-transporting ATPase subunit F [Anaerolineaceae bacterium]|nr:K(+)-transporting ATPase subunit F [Anaerolineaceae bacterium]
MDKLIQKLDEMIIRHFTVKKISGSKSWDNNMTTITGIIALVLLVYLFVSLFKPEWFG